jgi:hypothetical protein
MTEHIGTATVKVLPDLSEFAEIIAAVPDAGLTVTEDVSFEYNDDGQVSRRITTRTVTKAI